MQVSARADYALRAVVHLAICRGDLAQTGEIAIAEGIPAKFLEQILLDLKRAGIVASKRGIGGGYSLAVSPEEISVGSVAKIFDASNGPVGGIERMRFSDDLTEAERCLRPTWLKLSEAIDQVLGETSIASVAARCERVSRGKIVTHGTAWF